VKREHYFSRIRDGHVRWRPGVVRIVNELHNHKVQRWIVTSSGRSSVQALLDHAKGVLPEFDGVVTSDDVATGKPSPDGYRLALKRSGISPSCGLAMEDSAVGLKAARAADLSCLLTPSPWDKDLVETCHLAAAVLNHLGDQDKPSRLQHGPPCLDGMVTMNYMQSLLAHSLS
jgi:HAD superfamily hydrolase (TIGR01509 family)